LKKLALNDIELVKGLGLHSLKGASSRNTRSRLDGEVVGFDVSETKKMEGGAGRTDVV